MHNGQASEDFDLTSEGELMSGSICGQTAAIESIALRFAQVISHHHRSLEDSCTLEPNMANGSTCPA